VNRTAQGVVLLLFGGAILRASVTDLHLRYVKESLQPFLIAAGVLLIAAAVMTLVYAFRDERASAGGAVSGAVQHDADGHDGDDGHADDGHADDGHGHGHREPRVAWLLILPVLGLLLVAPPALGSFAAGQAGTALSSQEASDYAPLPEGDPAVIGVLDYASRAVFDAGRSLGDRRVTVTGFITTGAEGEPLLARMILSCCAADGRPIKVGLTGNAPVGVPADTWVDVTGRYTPRMGTDAVNGERIPFLDVESWVEVSAPRNQYE
jgi:uncharacterized repeat protein (TIGR03943 family)